MHGDLDLPIAYYSRSLSDTEERYSTIEEELLAMVKAAFQFRYCLFGRKFTFITDHKPLVWVDKLKDPTARLKKFYLKLRDFEFDVIYKEGRMNYVADALSRNPSDLQQINAITSSSSDSSDIFIKKQKKNTVTVTADVHAENTKEDTDESSSHSSDIFSLRPKRKKMKIIDTENSDEIDDTSERDVDMREEVSQENMNRMNFESNDRNTNDDNYETIEIENEEYNENEDENVIGERDQTDSIGDSNEDTSISNENFASHSSDIFNPTDVQYDFNRRSQSNRNIIEVRDKILMFYDKSYILFHRKTNHYATERKNYIHKENCL